MLRKTALGVIIGLGVAVAEQPLSIDEKVRLMNSAETPKERWARVQEEELRRRVEQFVEAWKKHVDKLNHGEKDLRARKAVDEAYERLKKTEGW